MAGWNGSDRRGNSTPVKPKVSAKKPSPIRGLVAGVLVCALAACAYFVFFADGNVVDSERDGTSKLITDAKSAKKSRTKTPTDKADVIAKKIGSTNALATINEKPVPSPENDYNGSFVVGRRRHKQKPIFALPAEGQLDSLVNTPVGGTFYGEEMFPGFMEDFKASLTNKIVIADDDPPDVVDRKERVIAAKEDLRKAYEAGEDVEKIVRDAKKEMAKKFESYCEFEHKLFEMRANNATKEEIAEYAIAAKAVMESHGIEEHLPLSADDREAVRELNKLIGLNDDSQGGEAENPQPYDGQQKENLYESE